MDIYLNVLVSVCEVAAVIAILWQLFSISDNICIWLHSVTVKNTALYELYKQMHEIRANHDILDLKPIIHALEEAECELSSLDGLIAADANKPDETWEIDTSETFSNIRRALGVLDKFNKHEKEVK